MSAFVMFGVCGRSLSCCRTTYPLLDDFSWIAFKESDLYFLALRSKDLIPWKQFVVDTFLDPPDAQYCVAFLKIDADILIYVVSDNVGQKWLTLLACKAMTDQQRKRWLQYVDFCFLSIWHYWPITKTFFNQIKKFKMDLVGQE